MRGNGNASFTVTSFKGQKSQQKRNSPFFFYHHNSTCPRGQGRLDHSQRKQVAHFLITPFGFFRRHAPCTLAVRYGAWFYFHWMLGYGASTNVSFVFHEQIVKLCENVLKPCTGRWAQRSWTSLSCDSGPGMGAISSGSARLRISRSERPASVGSVEDKN